MAVIETTTDFKLVAVATHMSDQAQVSAMVVDLFPKLNAQEQKISLGLYRLLAEGMPVSCTQLATALNLQVSLIKDALN